MLTGRKLILFQWYQSNNSSSSRLKIEFLCIHDHCIGNETLYRFKMAYKYLFYKQRRFEIFTDEADWDDTRLDIEKFV